MLGQLAEATDATKSTLSIHVLLDQCDPKLEGYLGLSLPDNYKVVVGRRNLPGKLASEYALANDDGFLGHLGDDVRPATEYWDQYLHNVAMEGGGNIAFGDDGNWGDRLATHPFLPTKFIRVIGAWVPEPLKHFFCDNLWHELGKGAGRLKYLPDVKYKHLHPAFGSRVRDEITSGLQQYYAHDEAIYNDWMRIGQIDIWCNRLDRVANGREL